MVVAFNQALNNLNISPLPYFINVSPALPMLLMLPSWYPWWQCLREAKDEERVKGNAKENGSGKGRASFAIPSPVLHRLTSEALAPRVPSWLLRKQSINLAAQPLIEKTSTPIMF